MLVFILSKDEARPLLFEILAGFPWLGELPEVPATLSVGDVSSSAILERKSPNLWKKTGKSPKIGAYLPSQVLHRWNKQTMLKISSDLWTEITHEM